MEVESVEISSKEMKKRTYNGIERVSHGNFIVKYVLSFSCFSYSTGLRYPREECFLLRL